MTPTVLLFLKVPEPGRVKTRLAAELGEAEAVAIYRRLAERQLAAVPAEWPVQIHFAPVDGEAAMVAWLGRAPGRSFRPQADGGLGERLARATEQAFAEGAQAVLLIGGDCPGLDEPLLCQAARVLADHDAVLGPAQDGGYYLLGLKGAGDVFADVRWSTAVVAEQTRAHLRRHGWCWAELPVLRDVDTAADWRAVALC